MSIIWGLGRVWRHTVGSVSPSWFRRRMVERSIVQTVGSALSVDKAAIIKEARVLNEVYLTTLNQKKCNKARLI